MMICLQHPERAKAKIEAHTRMSELAELRILYSIASCDFECSKIRKLNYLSKMIVIAEAEEDEEAAKQLRLDYDFIVGCRKDPIMSDILQQMIALVKDLRKV